MTVFELSLDAAGAQLGFDLRVNGFSVFASVTPRHKTLSSRIDGFTVPGENRIHATVYGVPRDPNDPEPPGFQMRVLATPAGETRDEMDLLVIAAFAEEALRLAPEGRTDVLDHRFTLNETRARPRFLDARPMDSETFARDVSTQLIAAFERKDAALVRRFFAHRFDELAAQSGLARIEFEDGFMDPIEHAMRSSSYVVDRAAGAQLEIEPGWGYRVMHVRGPSGRPVVTVRGGGAEVSLSWSVADIDGRPTIVR